MDKMYPNIGEHIFVNRAIFGIKLYEHHGIYVGEGKVVHYNGLANGIVFEKACFEELLSNLIPLNKRKIAMVEIADFDDFTMGDSWQIKEHANAKRIGKEAATYAKGRIKEQKYNLLINNCEHFCNECVMDMHASDQVDQMRSKYQIFNEIEPILSQMIVEMFGAKNSDEMLQSGLKSLTKLNDKAKQYALLRVKTQQEQAKVKVDEILAQSSDMNAKIIELKNTLIQKIARDFGIEI